MPLSKKQMEYLALAWQCFEAEPKIDYEKFKDVAGLASAASARELMRVTKKKLKEEYGALSGGMQSANTNGTASPVKKTGAPKSVNSTPASNKRGRKKKTADDGGEDDEESPTMKTKRSKSNHTVKEEPADEDSDDGLGPFQV